MTLAELITVFRARATDTAVPYLWSDEEISEYATDAENEAAERGRLIRDSTTAEICTVAVTAGISTYMLDSRILSVERAKMTLGSTPLTLTSTAEMDGNKTGIRGRFANWETNTGMPTRMLLDDEQGQWKATLYPIPTVGDTLRMQVFRLPIGPLSADEGNVPEIHARLHIKLVDWMMFRAYGKQDAETIDKDKALKYEAAFSMSFGQQVDANVRRKQEDRQPAVVQFREF